MPCETVKVMPAGVSITTHKSYGRLQIMSEARWGKRFEQRLEATYGAGHCDEKGYVYDVAPFGLFLSGDRF